MLGILPTTGTLYDKTKAINAIIANLDDRSTVTYQDFGPKLLDKDGKILPGMLADGVHPTRQGYEVWGKEMAPTIVRLVR